MAQLPIQGLIGAVKQQHEAVDRALKIISPELQAANVRDTIASWPDLQRAIEAIRHRLENVVDDYKEVVVAIESAESAGVTSAITNQLFEIESYDWPKAE